MLRFIKEWYPVMVVVLVVVLLATSYLSWHTKSEAKFNVEVAERIAHPDMICVNGVTYYVVYAYNVVGDSTLLTMTPALKQNGKPVKCETVNGSVFVTFEGAVLAPKAWAKRRGVK